MEEEDNNNKNSQSRKFKSVKLVWAHYGGKVRDLPKCDKRITVNQVHISLVYIIQGAWQIAPSNNLKSMCAVYSIGPYKEKSTAVHFKQI